MEWQSDILGPGFEVLRLRGRGRDGVRRTATLVRFTPPERRPGRHCSGARRATPAVLFLHGWSDYFFNVELARVLGPARASSSLPWTCTITAAACSPDTPGGYVADLDDYDAEIGTAVGIIGSTPAGGSPAAARR